MTTNLSKASRRVAARVGNLTDHQQWVFAWLSVKGSWKPGSRSGNYSTPSGTLRDVQAVAKKGHFVQREDGTYVVSDATKALVSDALAQVRAEERARDEARMAEYNARQFVVVVIDLATGQSHTEGGIYTGPDGSTNAHDAAKQLRIDSTGTLVRVIELGSQGINQGIHR